MAPVQAAAALGALFQHAVVQQAAAASACLKRVLNALCECDPDTLGGECHSYIVCLLLTLPCNWPHICSPRLHTSCLLPLQAAWLVSLECH